MLPRWHILTGGIFSLALWYFFPQTEWYYLAIVFFSSFLLDFDHYIDAVLKTKKSGLFNAFEYHKKLMKQEKLERKKGIRKRGDFHVLHTVEFHMFVFALGFLHPLFFYVFAGMIFHSLVDFISFAFEGRLYRREYLLSIWIRDVLKSKQGKVETIGFL